jgi:hypothetical protein
MYKDSPHEGFTWRKYLRSTLLSALLALVWQGAAGFGLESAGARVVLFGLTYVSERGLVELYKTYLRAPVEGFETLKFFRSPVLALAWSLLVACFTRSYPFVVLCGLGYTVATIETYKTFFFPNRPRGKFAGKPVLFPRLLTWRYRFAPLYGAIWLAVLANIALALGEPRRGLLGSPSSAGVSVVSAEGAASAPAAAGR